MHKYKLAWTYNIKIEMLLYLKSPNKNIICEARFSLNQEVISKESVLNSFGRPVPWFLIQSKIAVHIHQIHTHSALDTRRKINCFYQFVCHNNRTRFSFFFQALRQSKNYIWCGKGILSLIWTTLFHWVSSYNDKS